MLYHIFIVSKTSTVWYILHKYHLIKSFNTYYFINLHAILAQNITWTSAPDLIHVYVFLYN